MLPSESTDREFSRDFQALAMPYKTAQPDTCFFELDATRSIARRAVVEALGTLLLVFMIASSGLTARMVFHEYSLLGRIAGAVVTGGALSALIIAFGSASGAHFNPLISLLQAFTKERPWCCAFWYVTAQLCGSFIGALLANGIFAAAPAPVTARPNPWPLAISELLSSAALMTIVFSCSRSGRRDTGPLAVGIWIVAASLAMPSASLANPAVTLAALVVHGPLELPGRLALFYFTAQCAGALIAWPLFDIAYPRDAAG